MSSKITFKKVNRKKNFRKARNEEDSDEDDSEAKKAKNEEEDLNLSKLEETRELQKLRQRTSGLSHVTLAVGKKVSRVEEEVGVDAQDPFKLKTGGLLDLKKAKMAKALEDPNAERLARSTLC